MHVPPFKHGISRHSFRSTHPLPSDDTTIPSPQLNRSRDIEIEKSRAENNYEKLERDDPSDKLVCTSRFICTCIHICSTSPHIRMALGRRHSSTDYLMHSIARRSLPLQLVPIVFHSYAAEAVNFCRPTCWRGRRKRRAGNERER